MADRTYIRIGQDKFHLHYRNVLIPKNVIVVMLWALVIHAHIVQYLVAGYSDGTTSPLRNLVLLSFLFTPLMGYLGEKFVRYNLLMWSVVMIIVFTILFYTLEIIQGQLYEALSTDSPVHTTVQILTGTTDFFQKFGIQIFTTNIIQFGISQLHEAPSASLAAFGRWYILFYFIPISFNFLVSYIAQLADIQQIVFFIRLVVLSVITAATLPCIHFIFKRHLVIEPKPRKDPIKQIFEILKYAFKSKGPQRRSAFTYGEAPPSRLDQAKQRYGGPFTSEEVENVKSFWRVLLIVILVMSFTLNLFHPLTKPYLDIVSYNNDTLNAWEVSILQYPALYRTATVVISVAIFQLVYVPLFPRYVPNMLVRMMVGYSLVTVSNWLGSITSVVLVKELESSNLCLTENELFNASFNVESISEVTTALIFFNTVLNGLGNGLTYTASLEFIMAQAPLQMKGLIIGFWYGRLTVQGIIRIIETTILGCYPEFHFTISCIFLVMLISLVLAAYHYNYRQRNESSDVNLRANIEAVYERNLINTVSMTTSEWSVTSRNQPTYSHEYNSV